VRVLRKELAEVHIMDLGMVLPQSFPSRPLAQRNDCNLWLRHRNHLIPPRDKRVVEMNKMLSFRTLTHLKSIPVDFVAVYLTRWPSA
jgi:hypothetical protein